MQCMKSKKAGTQNKRTIRKAIIKIIPSMLKVSPVMYSSIYLFFILSAALEAGSAPVMEIIFDAVARTIKDGTVRQSVWIGILVLLVVKIGEQIGSSLENFLGEAFDLKAYGHFSKIIHQKINQFPAEYLEHPEILGKVEKAYQGIWSAIDFNNTCMDILTYYIPYLIVMGIYLLRLNYLLIFVMVIVFATILFGQVIKARIYRGVEDKASPLRRELDHFQDCISKKEYTKETRTLGAFSYFRKKYKMVMEEYHCLQKENHKKALLAELGIKITVLFEYLGILALLTFLLLQEDISVAAFAVVFSSVDGMFSMIDSLVTGRVGNVAEKYGKLERFLDFLDLKTEDISAAEEKVERNKAQTIEVSDVSYCYPASEKESLCEINFTLKAGEIMAVVGANGSGKSTLVKLLTGLYPPSTGWIRINGKDCTSKDGQWIAQTAVFQNYGKYKLTLEENIRIGEINKKEGEAERTEQKALELAGLTEHHSCFPDGMETMIAPEFGGIDLSGGQWQRVAIARALYRDYVHIFLDEPTAAIDPIEEIELYKTFQKATEGRTGVIVTHRLGAIKYANKVLVLKEGKQLFFGTHEEALKKCELYRQMWETVK